MRGSVRIHPNTCTCRRCKKKKKTSQKEEKKVIKGMCLWFCCFLGIVCVA